MVAVIVDSNVKTRIGLVGLSVMSLCMRKYRAHLQLFSCVFPHQPASTEVKGWSRSQNSKLRISTVARFTFKFNLKRCIFWLRNFY